LLRIVDDDGQLISDDTVFPEDDEIAALTPDVAGLGAENAVRDFDASW
jgi:hypothetical protein